MLVNTLQYHDTVDFVQDSETEDPHKGALLRMRRRRQGFYEEELRLTWKRRDLAATFRWSCLFGGRRWGAKKRLPGDVGGSAFQEGWAG